MTKSRKKVILFIVEGSSDEILLRSFKLIFSEEIRFAVIHGDITSNEETEVHNIRSRLNTVVVTFCKKSSMLKKDICQIVHVVDTDGAYLPDNSVDEVPNTKVVYEDQRIVCSNALNIINRNHKKQSVLNVLIGLSAVSKIPYSVYYFSCNLDHFFHNNANLENHLKNDYAEELDRQFARNPNDFFKLLSCPKISSSLNYTQSWDYIKQALNSLSRYTNLNLILDSRAKNGPQLISH